MRTRTVRCVSGASSQRELALERCRLLGVPGQAIPRASQRGLAALQPHTDVSVIDEILARFMQSVDQAMAGLEQKAGALQVKTDRTPIGGTITRDGGRLAANVEFDDGTTKVISAIRDKGQLRIVPEVDDSP